jgi:hypothetical protein
MVGHMRLIETLEELGGRAQQLALFVPREVDALLVAGSLENARGAVELNRGRREVRAALELDADGERLERLA